MNKLRKPESDFTQIPNGLLRDKRLSLKAKGVYCLLYSKPDDWTYVEEVLVRESADGRDAFRSAVAELANAGWLSKKQVRTGGVFSFTEIWLHTVAGKSVDGSSVDGKSDTTKTDETNTDKPTPPTPKGEPKGFEEVWKAKWSRGTAPNPRQPALKAYAAALKRGSSPADILAGVKARVGVDKEGTLYAPQLATWLNQERWTDAGGTVVVTAEDLEASRRRQEELKRQHEEQIREAQEQRRREWGLTA